MLQAQDNQSPLQHDQRKPKGHYTGERLLRERPLVYNRVVRLLAEPREHVSIREICRQCRVTDDTVKAVEKREAISIAARKEALMVQAARIAKLAYDRVEDQIDSAPLPQAVVTAGVFTDKLQLLSGDATAHLQNVNLNIKAVNLVAEWNKFHEAILEKLAKGRVEEKVGMTRHQLALPGGETIRDSDAETDLQSGKGNS
jgi:predicted Zn-ribbon and HTH transcriptional regulator